MKLSVVMSVRNGEPYVHEAIESVLTQSITDYEFLIVDDASTDNTSAVLREYSGQDSRIRVLHNERNLGPYPSTNRALMRAQGAFIARHDADDISSPDRFAIQLAALESDEEASLAIGTVDVFGESGRQVRHAIRPPSWQPRLEWELLFTNVVGAGAHVMFPRVWRAERVLFPARYAYAEDYWLWCKLINQGRVACPPEVVYRYRQHGSSITSTRRAEQDECLSEIRHEYQSQYFKQAVSRGTVDELSRFWTQDGSQPVRKMIPNLTLMLEQLRANFLDYIEQRYGFSQRTTLEAEIDEALRDRLGYWLYRALKLGDVKACGDLLSIAGAQQQAVSVSRRALGRAAQAVFRRIQREPRQVCGWVCPA